MLTFAPAVASTLTLSGGSWNAAGTIYTATYDVADAGVVATGVTVDVSGAQDANGNAQDDYTAEAEFSIDTAEVVRANTTDVQLLITSPLTDQESMNFVIAATLSATR